MNPWGSGSWTAYTEYYQWSPTHNSNSKSFAVASGDTLHGSLVYNSATDSYTLTQTCVETGATSSQVVAAQNGKKYNIPYVVYEKTFPCVDYPPDEIVTFTDIVMECDNVDCAADTVWTAAVKDANCNMQAHISDGNKEISITWDTSAKSKYDGISYKELFELNYHGEWAKSLNLTMPEDI